MNFKFFDFHYQVGQSNRLNRLSTKIYFIQLLKNLFLDSLLESSTDVLF